VASHVNILFLCVLPSQFTTVAEEIRGHIMKGCIVYSLVSAVSIPRLKQLLGYNNIIHPEIEFSEIEAPWDYTMDITGAFCKREILEQTCPITWKKQGWLWLNCMVSLYVIENYQKWRGDSLFQMVSPSFNSSKKLYFDYQ